MALINEAFEVLSDPKKRQEYDVSFSMVKDRRSSDYGESETDPPPTSDPLEHDWEVACEYYPDLKRLESELSKLSNQSSMTFKSYLLEFKAFERSLQVADSLRRQFLQLYFGNSERIKALARSLIEANHHAAAKSLNQAIRVLGPDANSEVIINRLKVQYPNISEPATIQPKWECKECGETNVDDDPRAKCYFCGKARPT